MISLSLVSTFGALILISGSFARHQLPANFLTDLSSSVSPIKQASTECTPEEYYRRLEFLICDEEYIEAVQEGIENSACKNIFYTEEANDFDYIEDGSDCEFVIDSRADVDNCSFACSSRQFYYYYCTYLWDDFVQINEECRNETDRIGLCKFDKGDFCLSYYNSTYIVLDACGVDDDVEAIVGECDETCRDAVKQMKEETGCCVDSFVNGEIISSVDSELLGRVFSACDVEVPGQCTSSSPPQEFLECAGIEAVGAAAIISPFYVATFIIAIIGIFI